MRLQLLCLVLLAVAAAGAPLPIKVVVVTMFERGRDLGDQPGEFQLWVEREHLNRVMPLPGGYHPVRLNYDGVLGMVTGIGTAKASASVMALGLDPRFDLTHAYWVIAGIGGGDPADISLGSAVWAEHVLDGDLGYEIDAREIPRSWSTGYVPLRRTEPFEQPVRNELEGEVYGLNAGLVRWAFGLTRAMQLPDDEGMRKSRARYAGFPECAEAAVCYRRRHTVGEHILAWRGSESLGKRVGEVLHARHRQLHDFGDGGFGYATSAYVPESSEEGRSETGAGAACGEQL